MSFRAVFKSFNVWISNRYQNTLISYPSNNLKYVCIIRNLKNVSKILALNLQSNKH
jgi:hypothetical protein